MQKATEALRKEIETLDDPFAQRKFWTSVGFTMAEAIAMVKGSGFNKPVWQVGNVQYAQAISAEHARKIHMWNFGITEETQLIETRNGTKWVTEWT